MLKDVDLGKKFSKENLKKIMEASLGAELGQMQRDCRDAGMPIIIVIEGWRHSRRSEILGLLMQNMDARGFRVYSASKFCDELLGKTFFAPFWQQLPAPGGIAVYRHSWYYMKNVAEIKGKKSLVKPTTFEHINAFEKQLLDGHYCLLKFFIHISEETQKENIKKTKKFLGKAWKEIHAIYSEEDDYNNFYKKYDEMLEATNTKEAPWHIVDGDDLQNAQLELYTTVVKELRKALVAFKLDQAAKKPSTGMSAQPVADKPLSKVDLSKTITKEEYKTQLDAYQEKLRVLQVKALEAGLSTIIAFEGWDAGGKGGAIKRLTNSFDPMGYQVNPTSAPNAVEKQYQYMWRFWINMPRRGEIAIFDRTWYGRVMVERVEHFTPDEDWQRAYEEINETEKQWYDDKVAIAKFWLQIDKDEQEKRFKERESDPSKEWKITDEDWRNRGKWNDYEVAVNEMIARTSTTYAPWTIVEANEKEFARIKVLKTVAEMLEARLKQLK